MKLATSKVPSVIENLKTKSSNHNHSLPFKVAPFRVLRYVNIIELSSIM